MQMNIMIEFVALVARTVMMRLTSKILKENAHGAVFKASWRLNSCIGIHNYIDLQRKLVQRDIIESLN